MGEHWTFRGDNELDPILRKWTDTGEKSFHVRQALRKYLYEGRNNLEGHYRQQCYGRTQGRYSEHLDPPQRQ